MRIGLYTPVISPHQLPLARAIVSCLGAENFRYVYTTELREERRRLGWSCEASERWCVRLEDSGAQDWIVSCEVLLVDLRDWDIIRKRAERGLRSFYMSERWFKPPVGMGRLLLPRFTRMAVEFFRLVRSGSVEYLPMGVWAAHDMIRLNAFLRGKVWDAMKVPMLSWGGTPLSRVDGFPWMRMWGYCVRPSTWSADSSAEKDVELRRLKVLWVGRFLAWKRVDTLLRAVASCADLCHIELTLVGDGPMREEVRRSGEKWFSRHPESLRFLPSVPADQVRELMREHDVYVLPSDGYEGWGAVVSEALEEGMEVLGTCEAGSSATILPRENLFHAGDWRALAVLLKRLADGGPRHCHGIGFWSAKAAARILIESCMEREHV